MTVQNSSYQLTSGKIAKDAIVAAPVRLSQTGPDFHTCPAGGRWYERSDEPSAFITGKPERRIQVGSLYH